MERVALVIESTGERLSALLNPDHVEVRRVAGVRRRRSVAGPLTRTGLADDPLLYTGGGVTQLELQLLFDVTLAGSTIETRNVRDLTAAFWNLAENEGGPDRYGRPPLVLFVWGKSWNFPGIVSAVAERFEHFDTSGVPRRSWMSLRLTRVADADPSGVAAEAPPPPGELPYSLPPASLADSVGHEVMGVGQAEGVSTCGERLDEIAFRYYGDPAYWRFLAALNDLDDPTCLEPGMTLQIPPRRILEELQ
jgi:hypothetical protein